MIISLDSIVQAKLSIQEDGEEFTVGDPVSGTFIRVPYEAVHVINLLDGKKTVKEISHLLNEEAMDVDVLDFVETLHELELIYSIDEEVFLQDNETKEPNPFLSFLSAALFHPILQAGYLLLFIFSIIILFMAPELVPSYEHFWVFEATGMSLLLLFITSWPLTIIHEFGHFLAALRLGIPVKFRLSLRFYWLVVEADMTGLWSVSKKKRYLPYAAGMAFDSAILFIVLVGQFAVSGFLLSLFKMITLLLVLRFAWQLLIFLRTDIYFLIMNSLNMPSLHGFAKVIIREILTKKRNSKESMEDLTPKEFFYVKVFTSFYLIGGAVAAVLLFYYSIPGLYVLLKQTYIQVMDNPLSTFLFWDGILTLFVLSANAIIWCIGALGKYRTMKLERVVSKQEADVTS